MVRRKVWVSRPTGPKIDVSRRNPAPAASIRSTSTAPLSPRWRRLPGQRAAHISSAALEAFVENGFAATRLEDVAQRAGVSKGTLYLYFESKQALFKAAVRENIVPF